MTSVNSKIVEQWTSEIPFDVTAVVYYQPLYIAYIFTWKQQS